MTDKIVLTQADVNNAALSLAHGLSSTIASLEELGTANPGATWYLYGVPRGGVPAAALVALNLSLLGRPVMLTDSANTADIIIDDIVETGETMKRLRAQHAARGVLFGALYGRIENWTDLGVHVGQVLSGWLVFPWEMSTTGDDSSADDIVTRLLSFVGEDPTRGGLQETPKRVLKAWKFWTSGYDRDPAAVLKVFEDGAERVDEMVLVRDIPLYSHCEHHLAPIFGVAHVAYIPDGKIVGLSKLSRLVDIYARRLQVQERLTNQVADALAEHLKPKGVGVVLECRHLCMESRGVCQQGHVTVTSALRGVLRDDAAARAEFLNLTSARKRA
jgi:GTP cyclohydrolase I